MPRKPRANSAAFGQVCSLGNLSQTGPATYSKGAFRLMEVQIKKLAVLAALISSPAHAQYQTYYNHAGQSWSATTYGPKGEMWQTYGVGNSSQTFYTPGFVAPPPPVYQPPMFFTPADGLPDDDE